MIRSTEWPPLFIICVHKVIKSANLTGELVLVIGIITALDDDLPLFGSSEQDLQNSIGGGMNELRNDHQRKTQVMLFDVNTNTSKCKLNGDLLE